MRRPSALTPRHYSTVFNQAVQNILPSSQIVNGLKFSCTSQDACNVLLKNAMVKLYKMKHQLHLNQRLEMRMPKVFKISSCF